MNKQLFNNTLLFILTVNVFIIYFTLADIYEKGEALVKFSEQVLK